MDTTEIKIKFITKNIENINKLNKYIDENRDDIRMMIVSPELLIAFKEYYPDDCTDYQESSKFLPEHLRYRGISMFQNIYSVTKRIYFVKKSESIDLNIPCVCGYYDDEIHP